MQRGADDARTTPTWGPVGSVPFPDSTREVHAWINVATGAATPSQQAAALQRGLEGLARTIAVKVSPAVVDFGVSIGGRHTDGAT
eukprot:5172150-Pyramimonas_sp.AAC.1